ncbi:hypothetical protein ES703_111035 [subsurface metagenome]
MKTRRGKIIDYVILGVIAAFFILDMVLQGVYPE